MCDSRPSVFFLDAFVELAVVSIVVVPRHTGAVAVLACCCELMEAVRQYVGTEFAEGII